MFTFNDLWQLLYDHGATDTKKGDCAQLWDRLTAQQQQQLITTITTKLRQNKFVHYDPIRAMRENIRKASEMTLSFNDYYTKYGTTEECDGWKRQFIPEKQTTIYVKNV